MFVFRMCVYLSLIASPADCHRLLANSLPVMNITSTARETGNFHVRSTRTNDLCCLRRKLSEAQLRGLYKGTGIRLGPSPGAPLGDALSISAASCRASQPNDPTHTRTAIQLQFSELVAAFFLLQLPSSPSLTFAFHLETPLS